MLWKLAYRLLLLLKCKTVKYWKFILCDGAIKLVIQGVIKTDFNVEERVIIRVSVILQFLLCSEFETNQFQTMCVKYQLPWKSHEESCIFWQKKPPQVEWETFVVKNGKIAWSSWYINQGRMAAQRCNKNDSFLVPR